MQFAPFSDAVKSLLLFQDTYIICDYENNIKTFGLFKHQFRSIFDPLVYESKMIMSQYNEIDFIPTNVFKEIMKTMSNHHTREIVDLKSSNHLKTFYL